MFIFTLFFIKQNAKFFISFFIFFFSLSILQVLYYFCGEHDIRMIQFLNQLNDVALVDVFIFPSFAKYFYLHKVLFINKSGKFPFLEMFQ